MNARFYLSEWGERLISMAHIEDKASQIPASQLAIPHHAKDMIEMVKLGMNLEVKTPAIYHFSDLRAHWAQGTFQVKEIY